MLRDRNRRRVAICAARFLVALFCSTGLAQTPPAVGRPILFVHGICDDASDWTNSGLEANLINYVEGLQPSLYANPTPVTLYYDSQSQTVRTTAVRLSFERAQ